VREVAPRRTRNANLATDRLQVGEGEAFVARDIVRRVLLRFRRRAKDRGDFLIVVATLGHD